MDRFSGIRDWRFKQATKLEKKGIDKFGVGFACFLYETLRVACFHVRASVSVGAASPSGEGEVVRHHTLIIRV
ncbi:hypothetical protein PQG02_11090 [Nostoc sp. UHCC 0926]|uniref:hypothetical protein n=1 Tax=unclassified Nostoc TaxID=2593658 RepID=UPI00235DD7D9|nr:hypothetical protein [Nostoc sp. UHCC 0926]WDD34819.1 hypothetical protein PQG02_11090 [Nostoc sp. UHCC 0926]